MIALAKSIAQELGSRGIRANAIAPGFIMTDMTASLSEEIKAEWWQENPVASRRYAGRRGKHRDLLGFGYVFLRFRTGDSGRWRNEHVNNGQLIIDN